MYFFLPLGIQREYYKHVLTHYTSCVLIFFPYSATRADLACWDLNRLQCCFSHLHSWAQYKLQSKSYLILLFNFVP